MVANMTSVLWRVGIVVVLLAGTYPNIGAQDVPDRICKKNVFSGRYYKNGSMTEPAAFTSCDRKIDFDWGSQGPSGTVVTKIEGARSDAPTRDADDIEESSPGREDGLSSSVSLGDDHYSARWKGRFQFTGGDYTFVATADDGVVVIVDGEKIIDAWRIQAPTEYRAARTLTPGWHQVEVWYFENDGGAMVRVHWD